MKRRRCNLKYLFWFEILAIVLIFTSCGKAQGELKTGQIFFCSYQSGALSAAIDAVTQTHENTHYSHMGLIEIQSGDTILIHASGSRGVVREKLSTFISIDHPLTVDIYELSHLTKQQNIDAISYVKQRIGQPYNNSFIMNDSSAYCSQLVYSAFNKDSVFQLNPMTFKDPGVDKFNKGWAQYFEGLNLQIPEGELGCNPNGMVANSQLEFITRLLPVQD